MFNFKDICKISLFKLISDLPSPTFCSFEMAETIGKCDVLFEFLSKFLTNK